MIEGFVGQVLPEVLFGWAFDPDQPSVHLVVDIYCADRHLGSATADIYRADLAKIPIGEGDHGFMFSYPSKLEERELAAITVRTRSASDPAIVHELPRVGSGEQPSAAQAAPGLSVSAYTDDSQYPVFVLGSARSGTSALARAVRDGTDYAGYNEGAILDLMTPLQQTVRHFYEEKEKIPLSDRAGMMISKIPEEYFATGISALFASAVSDLFPSRHWFDKTPTAHMILAAPSLLRLWPNARFIFMKRRGLENLMSRMRKFPNSPFKGHCSSWSACMEAWRSVRGDLAGRALELDQHFLARHPIQSAEAIGRLLTLEPKVVEKVAEVMGGYKPEQTGGSVLEVLDASTLTWDPSQWALFERICGPSMTYYGYSRDQNYYAPGAEERACLAL